VNFVNSTPNRPVTLRSAIQTLARDRWWWRKLLIGGALTLTIVGAPIVEGFQAESVENTANGFPVPLPLWRDLGGKAVRGIWGIVIDFFFLALPLLIGSMFVLCVVSGLTLGGFSSDVIARVTQIGVALVGLWLAVVWISSLSPVARRSYAVEGDLGAVLTLGLLRHTWAAAARPVYLRARLHSLIAYLPALLLLAIGFLGALPLAIRLLLLWLGCSALLGARLLVIQLYDAAAREIERRRYQAFRDRTR
jgi:hypothetical protein